MAFPGTQPHLTKCKSDSCCREPSSSQQREPAQVSLPQAVPQESTLKPHGGCPLSAFSIRHRLEPSDPASGRKVPHPRPLKPREMSQQHQIHRCLSLLCLKELVASIWKSAGWVCFECAAPRRGLYSLPSSAFKNFLFSFLFVPAGERLKGKGGGGG